MDGFGEDLFDVFNSTTSTGITTIATPSPATKRQLTQEKIEEVSKKAKNIIDIHIATEKVTKATTKSALSPIANDPNQLVSLPPSAAQKPHNILSASTEIVSSAQRAKEDYDVFDGYYEQVVVGTDKPENVKDQTQKTCAMQTCYPPRFDIDQYETTVNQQYKEKLAEPNFTPAKSYPFILDPFQAKAVECIEKNQSVLVAAHTSAGKTVCAEYAIAKSLKLGQRVIYTSPIKALSNQKYRELQAEFTDVGLMTGDVTINANASCLVMTTEILRNMLYRGSEVLREISWVIFDEVHYMRDRSRGVVWEETIILLPHKCRFVFLSATLLNSAEFACWVAKLHNQPCSVIYTNYRPTPLEHHVFARGSDGIHLIVDKIGDFKENNFQKALTALAADSDDPSAATKKDSADEPAAKKKKKGNGTSEDEVEMIVRKVKDLELDPCIVFSFSKKDCERYAKNMMKVDFCSDEERELIGTIYKRAIESLTEQDQRLPQVQDMAPLLKKGIGVHHGGLLPILKEIVELLFQEGLLRVLFSTETFSIGLNMPARTVVFTSMFKWDGLAHRALTSGEYIQMSGRAGRRGLDDKGVVILMLTQEVETNVVKSMMAGPSDPLMSSFRLGYNMLLNLFRLEESDPDHLMVRSFYQFQQQRAVPMLSATISSMQKQRGALIDKIRDTIAKQVLILKAMTLKDEQKNKNSSKSTSSYAKSGPLEDPPALKTDYPVIQLQDIQQYSTIMKNLNEQRYTLRKFLHRPEILRQFFTNQTRLVQIKGCIREGPPPLLGSAAAMAVDESYNDPVCVNNNDPSVERLVFEPDVLSDLQALRRNRALLDGSNATQAQNVGATNMSLVKRDDIQMESGLIPPGLDQTHAQLAQLATNNKTVFLEIQEGRLKDKELNFGWGVVLNVAKRTLPDCIIYGASTPLPPSTNRPGQQQRAMKESNEVTVFEVLLAVDPNTVTLQHERFSATSASNLSHTYALHEQSRPCPAGTNPKYIIVPILASAISHVSQINLKFDSVKTHSDRQNVGMRLASAVDKLNQIHKDAQIDYTSFDPTQTKTPIMFPLQDTTVPSLDLFGELGLWSPQLTKDDKKAKKSAKGDKEDDASNASTSVVQQLTSDAQKLKDLLTLNYRISRLHQQLSTLKLHQHPLRQQLLSMYQHKIRFDAYLQWLQYKLAHVSRDQTLRATLASMKRVLRTLQLLTDDDVITNKGRVACELSTCDELVGTELLYSSIFNSLNVRQLAAICSCLVFDEGSLGHDDQKPKLSEDLQQPYNHLEEHLKNVATIIKESAIPIDISKYVQSFNPFLMNVVFQWCEGATFAEIMKQSGNVFEGTVIRVMRRLEELLRQFASACDTLGNNELKEKFEATMVRLKRDIVFAASLYL